MHGTPTHGHESCKRGTPPATTTAWDQVLRNHNQLEEHTRQEKRGRVRDQWAPGRKTADTKKRNTPQNPTQNTPQVHTVEGSQITKDTTGATQHTERAHR